MACINKQNDWNFFRAEKVKTFYPLSEMQVDKKVPSYCDNTMASNLILKESADYILQEDSSRIEQEG